MKKVNVPLKPVLSFFVLLLLSGCRKENATDCFKSTGNEMTQERNAGEFSSIEINDKVIVTIFRGPVCNVEVVAGSHLIGSISTKVTNGILQISNNNRCNFVRGYKKVIKVNVTLPYLKKITNNSVGPVYFDENYTQDTLVVRAESSGDFYVRGVYNELRTSSHGNGDMYVNARCNSFYAYCNGTNYLYADSMTVSNYAFIQTLTFGDCFINAKGLNTFEYNIGSAGNIYYRGSPAHVTDYSDGAAKGRAIREE